MRDLSIIIPARNEEFLARTIEGILENKRGNTEIIAVLDGAWANPPIKDHDDVTLIYHNKSVGQRAAMNEAVNLSRAKYVMKCDAHCIFDEGFDVKMMEDMQDDGTMVPTMYNIHAFNWVCKKCGNKWYQGPTPTFCCKDKKGKLKNEKCDSTEFEREMVWKIKKSPRSTAFYFDRDLKFQYWGAYKKKQTGDLVETMSLLGACFMCTRDKYIKLDMADERHGSWGQQGTEVACKTWLSGGKLICTKKTWFGHLFRTQGDDFGFPYEHEEGARERAHEYSKNLWLNDKWKLAKYPLSWLISKFNPPTWGSTKGILYYTHNVLDDKFMKAVQDQIKKGAKDMPIVSVSTKKIDFGENHIVSGPIPALDIAKKILKGIRKLDTDYVFICEHDVLYHPTHFDFTPPRDDRYYYNVNVWKVKMSDGHALKVDDCKMTSGLCASRSLLLRHYKKRIKMIKEHGYTNKMGHEPGTHGRAERVDDVKAESWRSKYPNLDLVHDKNFTNRRWDKKQWRNKRFTRGWTESTVDKIEGWDNYEEIMKSIKLY